MKLLTWTVARHLGEYTVQLQRESLWSVCLEQGWDRLCGLTGGWLGGHGMPDWVPDFIADPLFELEEKIFTQSNPEIVERFIVHEQFVKRYFPDFYEVFSGKDYADE